MYLRIGRRHGVEVNAWGEITEEWEDIPAVGLRDGDQTPAGEVSDLRHDRERRLVRFTIGERRFERGFDVIVSRRTGDHTRQTATTEHATEYLVRTPDGNDHGRGRDLADRIRAADRLGAGAVVERLDANLCRTGEVVYRAGRGHYRGPCFTEGCPNTAARLPLTDPNWRGWQWRYRCRPCCDRLHAGQPL
jgi:hypothetical protein